MLGSKHFCKKKIRNKPKKPQNLEPQVSWKMWETITILSTVVFLYRQEACVKVYNWVNWAQLGKNQFHLYFYLPKYLSQSV